MRACALVSCEREAVAVVDHPHRDEDATPLCSHHEEVATAEVGAEVVSR
jgi:hypothetical protein